MGISQEKQKAQQRLKERLRESKFPSRMAMLAHKAIIENKPLEELIAADKKRMIRKHYSALQCEDCGATISANKTHCLRCYNKRNNLVQPFTMGDIK